MLTGKWVMTKGIATKVKNDGEFALFIAECVDKYLKQDWGDTCDEDSALNDHAVRTGNDRIVAKYDKIFIITEWDRSVTTILFTEEY